MLRRKLGGALVEGGMSPLSWAEALGCAASRWYIQVGFRRVAAGRKFAFVNRDFARDILSARRVFLV